MARKRVDSQTRDWAQGFGLLSDPTRLGILMALSGGPKNVTSICQELGLKQPTVSHHLGLLRMGRMVVGTRQGKSVIYESNKPALTDLADALKKLTPSK